MGKIHIEIDKKKNSTQQYAFINWKYFYHIKCHVSTLVFLLTVKNAIKLWIYENSMCE